MSQTTPTCQRVRVWDLPVRIFHRTLASSFVGAYLVGESESLRQVHVLFGYTLRGIACGSVVPLNA